MNINLSSGPSSWDRDMQGMQGLEEAESENLAALGMHIAGDDKKKDDEDEDDEDVKVKDDALAAGDEPADDEDADDEKKDEEEVDALEELEKLAEKLKEEESPTMVDDEE
jgi:hypothetical protein